MCPVPQAHDLPKRAAARGLFATANGLGQVAAHDQCVQFLPAGLPIVAFAAPGHHKAGAVIQPPRRLIIFLDFEKHGAHAASGEMPEVCVQQIAGKTVTAMVRGHYLDQIILYLSYHSIEKT